MPDPFDFSGSITPYINDAWRQQRDAVDSMLRVMILNPQAPGLSVRTEFTMSPDTFEVSIVTEVKFDPGVPRGEVRYSYVSGDTRHAGVSNG